MGDIASRDRAQTIALLGANQYASGAKNQRQYSVKYREISRLTAMGIGQRNVAFSVGYSTTTVQDVLRAARTVGLDWPLPEEVNDRAIRFRIYAARDRPNSTKANIGHA